MRIFPFAILAGLLIASCGKPSFQPVEQDGTELWLAAGPSYEALSDSIWYSFNPRMHKEGFSL